MTAVRTLVPGTACGPVAALAPLSFWGGYDPVAGCVTDRSHPALGQSLAGVVLLMPAGRGSSSSSSVLAEALRRGTGPAAIVLARPDPVLLVGALVARTLYAAICPVVVAPADLLATLAHHPALQVAAAAGETGVVTPVQASTKKNPMARSP